MKYLLISLLILFPIALSDLTHKCSDKDILDDSGHLNHQEYADVTLAYNGIGSCSSLIADNDDEVCCYIKLKFKNELYDEKFTHKGCTSIPVSALIADEGADIDDYIDAAKLLGDYYIDNTNNTYKIIYKDLDIDCNSKFLKFATGLCLLLLFL